MVGLMFGRPPECHDGVADVLIDRAALRLDAGRDEGEMFVQKPRRLGRRHTLGKRRETDDVGKHHGDIALF